MQRIRRLGPVIFSLLLTLALLTHGVQASAMMCGAAVSGASDMAMSGDCGGDMSATATCVVPCGGFAAVPTADVVLALSIVTVSTSPIVPIEIGWAAPPDPYPPKVTIPS
jgi:hypothetical protein